MGCKSDPGHVCKCHKQVCVNGQCSEEFDVGVSVHQGSVLSPLLFILVLEALSREFRSGVSWELLYAYDLIIIADSHEECVRRLKEWKAAMEAKGLQVNMPKTKMLISGHGLDILRDSGTYPCAVCPKGIQRNTILCSHCQLCVHKKCSDISGRLPVDPNFVCQRCRGLARPIVGRPFTEIPVGLCSLECVNEFYYLGDILGAGDGCENTE